LEPTQILVGKPESISFPATGDRNFQSGIGKAMDQSLQECFWRPTYAND
jgi:hypothetical protein